MAGWNDPRSEHFLGPNLSDLSLADLQALIQTRFGAKDARRSPEATFLWLMEEIGELATELRGHDRANLAAEFADVLAWLTTLANIMNVDLTRAVLSKYGAGCPGCGQHRCACDPAEKP